MKAFEIQKSFRWGFRWEGRRGEGGGFRCVKRRGGEDDLDEKISQHWGKS